MGLRSNQLSIIQTTLDDRGKAETMATRLIDQRLAACVQIAGPVVSVYRWQGELHREEEFIVTVKSSRNNCDRIIAFLEHHHPYELPEIIVFPMNAAACAYVEWVLETCK